MLVVGCTKRGSSTVVVAGTDCRPSEQGWVVRCLNVGLSSKRRQGDAHEEEKELYGFGGMAPPSWMHE